MGKALLVSIYTLYYAISCAPHNLELVKRYGFLEMDDVACEVDIEISEFKSFNSLCGFIEDIVCQGYVPVINIFNYGVKKKIRLANLCRKQFFCHFRKSRDLFKITDNIIDKGSLYTLESLEPIMYQQYYNPDKAPIYSDLPRDAVIQLSYEDENIDSLHYLLDRITEAYDELDIQCRFRVELRKDVPPPPPPPAILSVD